MITRVTRMKSIMYIFRKRKLQLLEVLLDQIADVEEGEAITRKLIWKSKWFPKLFQALLSNNLDQINEAVKEYNIYLSKELGGILRSNN